jgi:hypothetical protein
LPKLQCRKWFRLRAGAPKKSGKTGFAALYMLTMVLLFGGRFAEGYALANDLEQAQSRVFQAIKRIVEASPLLKREAKVTASTRSPSQRSTTPPSPPSRPITPVPLAPIRPSAVSMNSGATRPSAAVAYGTRW